MSAISYRHSEQVFYTSRIQTLNHFFFDVTREHDTHGDVNEIWELAMSLLSVEISNTLSTLLLLHVLSIEDIIAAIQINCSFRLIVNQK